MTLSSRAVEVGESGSEESIDEAAQGGLDVEKVVERGRNVLGDLTRGVSRAGFVLVPRMDLTSDKIRQPMLLTVRSLGWSWSPCTTNELVVPVLAPKATGY